jgi:nucleolar MIF4G domain-containing protein 1
MRQGDPAALKEILVKIQDKKEKTTKVAQTARFKFMLEMLDDLRNNKKKLVKGDSELVLTGKKNFVAFIRRRALSLFDPLNICLKDARNKETNAKWLITGFVRPKLETEMADKATAAALANSNDAKRKLLKLEKPNSLAGVDLVLLADQQKMNTDIRRAIFTVIMSANNYLDAFEKLVELKLTKKQAREIPKVIVHCVGQEISAYNPFYGLLGNHFVQLDKDYSVTTMYCLWDSVKELKAYTSVKLQNLAKFYGFLLGTKALQLSALKAITFEHVKLEKELDFFTCLMVSQALLALSSEDLLLSLKAIHAKPALYPFQESFEFFLNHLEKRVKKLNLSEDDRIKLRGQIGLALEALAFNAQNRSSTLPSRQEAFKHDAEPNDDDDDIFEEY